MRVSLRLFHEQGINAIVDQQALVGKSQMKIAIGKNILTPADDPVAATRIVNLKQEIAQVEQYQRNADFAQTRLQLEDATLGATTDTLFRVRDLIISGANTSLPDESRAAIATEITLRLDEMVSLANTKDGSGEYIFAGFQGNNQPFSRSVSGNLIYAGDEGQRFIQIGSSSQIAISDSGFDVFQSIFQGNGTFTTKEGAGNTGTGVIDSGSVTDSNAYVEDTYTIAFANNVTTGDLEYTVTGATSGVVVTATPFIDGSSISFNGIKVVITGTPKAGDTFTVAKSQKQSAFATIENAISAMQETDKIKRLNAINRVISDLDQDINRMSEIRAKIGARLNTIELENDVNSGFVLFSQKNLSRLEDLDFAKAASDLTRQTLALEAAQKSFVSIQSLNLFSFLRL